MYRVYYRRREEAWQIQAEGPLIHLQIYVLLKNYEFSIALTVVPDHDGGRRK
jgi:hypothetical protein